MGKKLAEFHFDKMLADIEFHFESKYGTGFQNQYHYGWWCLKINISFIVIFAYNQYVHKSKYLKWVSF